MGLRRGGSSESPIGTEEEKFSKENRFPVSDDEVVPPDQILKNNIKLEKMEEEDDEIIQKYKNHMDAQINQKPREMEGGNYSDNFNYKSNREEQEKIARLVLENQKKGKKCEIF